MNKLSTKLLINALIILAVVICLLGPLQLLADIRASGADFCNEYKKYLLYSKERVKALQEREIKLQNDQAEYAKKCATGQVDH